MSRLPTPAEMLARAQEQMDTAAEWLSSAATELWSDWPSGYVMTEEQTERRTRMFRAIHKAKAAIEEAKR